MSIACEWFRKALDDLRAARILLEEGLVSESAFHSQQAVEKALKALIVALGMKPPKSHRIEKLLGLLEGKVDVRWAYEQDLPALTFYAVEVRYPGPPVVEEEAEEALRIAENVVEWVRGRLGERGVVC